METTELQLDDFAAVTWQDVIDACPTKECYAYTTQFFKKATEAETTGNLRAQAVYIALGRICSMMLQTDGRGEPFSPRVASDVGRSTALDDLATPLLDTLRQLAPSVRDPEMRARIADLLWVKKRDVPMAHLAVTSYLQAARTLEHPENWSTGFKRITRATHVAASLGRKHAAFAEAISHITTTLETYRGTDPLFFSARLSDLLLDQNEGEPTKLAEYTRHAAVNAEQRAKWPLAREYWEVNARCHNRAKDATNAELARRQAAETYVREAEEATRRTSPSFLVASHLLQCAIEAFRRIPGTKERVKQLHAQLLSYEKQGMAEMKSVSAELDVSKNIEQARAAVCGKPLQDALRSLASFPGVPRKAVLRTYVEQAAKDYPLQHLFPGVKLNAEGKTVAQQPQGEGHDGKEALLQAKMWEYAVWHHKVFPVSFIEPARAQILTDHEGEFKDLLPFVRNNPFIPEDRELLYAIGLHHGLHGRFLDAVHILIPQLENSVRYVLSQRGVITSGLTNGIQEEKDLNVLLRMPESETVFGEDILFNLRGLLIERLGTNLRNLLAHGLLTTADFNAPQMSYAWWAVLNLCYLAILFKESTETEEDEHAGRDSQT